MGHPGPAVNHNALIEQRNPHVDAESQAELDQRSSPVVSPQAHRRGRMADEVYETLLHQLMSKRIVPDSRVTIDALARELGVSQTPIRLRASRMGVCDTPSSCARASIVTRESGTIRFDISWCRRVS